MENYRRVYAKIDMDAILHNLEEVRKRIQQGKKVMAIIKADGYGHGAAPISKTIEEKVDYFGVTIVEEAIELRKNGIVKPILILGFSSPDQYSDILEYDVTQSIFQLETAQKLSKAAGDLGKTAKIHLVVDTGMARIGLKDCPESIKIVEQICKLPHLEVEGIFSHYACADMRDKTVSDRQSQRFLNFIDEIEKIGIHIPIKHMSNSAGIIEFDNSFDMVRLGIILYGLYPSDEVHKERMHLIPAMELKAHVIYTKMVEAGCGISYGHMYITDKKTKVATISVGYADGYPRALSSKGRVLINGKFAPIIGRVCMDQLMVDVTGFDDIEEENEVTLFGTDEGNTISVEEIGALAETINYEILCGISKRVPRVFIKDGKEFLMRSCFDD